MKVFKHTGFTLSRAGRDLRLPSLMAAMVWAVVFLWAAGSAAQTEPPAIRSAAEIDYPPFSIVDNQGRADGFSVELMRAALDAMGRDVDFRSGTWTEVREWLETGQIQALPLVGRTPEREHSFDFTVPYMSLHGAIVVRADNTDIHDLNELRGRSVAVLKGDNAEEFLRREDRGVDIHTTATFDEALRELARGRFDAVVAQRLVALRLIQETGLTDLRIVNKPIEGFRQDFCFAVREGDRETLALLNEGLALVMADGTYRHLHAKWFAALELPVGRRIVIGGDHNYPPFEHLDENGRPSGYNVELSRAIARAMGLDIEIRLGVRNRIVQDLEKGEIDVVQGMFYSPERDLKFDFTPPHEMIRYVGVVRRGEGPPPAAATALTCKRVAVQRGDVVLDFMKKEGLIDQVVLLETQEDVLRAVAEGKADCGITAQISALDLIEKQEWTNLLLGRQPIFVMEYCYAVANGHKALLSTFSEGLKLLDQTGEYRRIQDKWLGVYKEDAVDVITFLRYAAVVLVPLILVLLASLLWTWALRRQVAGRTAELAAVSERFRAILDAAPDIIMEVDAGKIYTWANPAGFEFFGKDVIGRPAADYFVEPQDTYRKVDVLFKGDENVVSVESLQRRQDGQERLLAWWCRVLKNNTGEVVGALSTARDITDRKRAEEEHEKLQSQLVQSQKMESVGRLAGGVAHDFNNMLNVIIGFTELSLEQIPSGDPLHENLNEILDAARRSAEITRQLLAFARRQIISPRPLDLNETVEGMLRMLRRLIGEDIDLAWEPGAGLWTVMMDPSQLDQVLANLLVNARDAIKGVGKITIETAKASLDENYCADRADFVPGDYALLTVSDNGCGMDKETLDNLFEPFFTTKSTGEGTGLGLAMVYGIIKQNNGFINVYSEPGQGATFKVYLPRYTGEAETIEEEGSAAIPPGKGETILVVEDEAAVLKLAGRVLTSLGYNVLTSSIPEAALKLAEAHTGGIDLLITDVIMPEMNGRDLAERLREHYPGLKILFMSGYTANVIAHHGILGKGVHFIQKPFSKSDLAGKVGEALDL